MHIYIIIYTLLELTDNSVFDVLSEFWFTCN